MAAPTPERPRDRNEVLRVEGLDVSVRLAQGEVPVISDLSLSLAQGETLGLVGESGSGKTLTGLAILDLIGTGGRVTGGSIVLNGTELRDLTPAGMEAVRGNQVAMVFQDPTTSLNPAFTVGSQIAEVLRIKAGLSRRAAAARAVELIGRVGIPRPQERARAYPHELSGGMAQRIAIARALSCNPSLLIADEPTTALDVTVQQEILDLFRDLQAEFGMAILFVTHDLAVAADICDRIAVHVCRRDRRDRPGRRAVRRPAPPLYPRPAASDAARGRPHAAAAGDPRLRAAPRHLAGRLSLRRPLSASRPGLRPADPAGRRQARAVRCIRAGETEAARMTAPLLELKDLWVTYTSRSLTAACGGNPSRR